MRPTGTGPRPLLTALRFIKDNRLLPRGFDKATAEAQIAVVGGQADPDFKSGGDSIRYLAPVGNAEGHSRWKPSLYQPIAFRWAMNLKPYEARSRSAGCVTTKRGLAPA